jgi:hypothetical protein
MTAHIPADIKQIRNSMFGADLHNMCIIHLNTQRSEQRLPGKCHSAAQRPGVQHALPRASSDGTPGPAQTIRC